MRIAHFISYVLSAGQPLKTVKFFYTLLVIAVRQHLFQTS